MLRICQAAPAHATTQAWQRVCLSQLTTKTTDKPTDEEEHRTDNNGFAKKRVQWLIEHSTSHQILWYVDSFVLRNPRFYIRHPLYRFLIRSPFHRFTFKSVSTISPK